MEYSFDKMILNSMYRKKKDLRLCCYSLKVISSFIGLVIFLLLPSIHSLSSLKAQARFTRLGQAEGLSNQHVNCILQDRNGFMWFGTNDGLNRYDGYSMAVYRTSTKDSNSIASNYITCLYEDSSGLLWIGTKGGGLNIYNPKTEKFTRSVHEPGNESSITNNDVLTIYYESKNKVWLGTDGGGLNLFDADTRTFQHFSPSDKQKGMAGNEILAVEKSASGELWLGTWDGGIYKMAPDQNSFTTMTTTQGAQIKHIWSLTNENNQKLWIGTFGYGLYCLDQQTQTLQPFALNPDPGHSGGDRVIWKVFIDQQQCMWVGTNNGLYKLEKGATQALHYGHADDDRSSLPSNKVVSIYQSSSGILWIGTDNGVCYLKPDTKKFQKNLKISKLENDNIRALAPAGNNKVWVAAENGGICRVDIEKSGSMISASLKEFPQLKTEGKVNMLMEDSKNMLWIGTRYGLISYNLTDRTTRKVYFDPHDLQSSSNDVMAVCETNQPGEYWVGTDNGLYRCNFKTGSFKNYTLETDVPSSGKSNHILTIYRDKKNNTWVSTWKGLNLYNPQSDSFSLIRDTWTNNLYINSLHNDSRGNLWLGTRNGLYQYNIAADTLYAYDEEDGLCNNNICCIVDDLSGNLWLSTNKGLSQFNLTTSEFKNFDTQDGLLNLTFNINSGFLSPDGSIFLGGATGLDVFIPSEIKTNFGKVPLVFNDFRIFNKTIPIGEPGSPLLQSITETKSMVLTARDEIFSIGFVALSFVNSNKCKYRYKLEGFEKEWTQVGAERKATYTNLRPGEYVFKVKASNEDGIWSNDELSLNITVLPPWWKTLWFKILLVMTAFLIFFGYYRFRIYRYHQHNKQLEKTIEERVQEIKLQKEKLSLQADELSATNRLLNEQKNEIERQGQDIARMNEILMRRNVNLEENVEELARARAMNTSVTFEEFQRIYPNDEACRQFIYELKLKGGFCCHSCQGTEVQELAMNYTRRCKKCGYIESVTVGTIFYHLKFPIVKAFYILYLVSTGHKLTVDQLSNLISLRRETCWTFKSKIEAHMSHYKRFRNPNEGWKEMIIVKTKV